MIMKGLVNLFVGNYGFKIFTMQLKLVLFVNIVSEGMPWYDRKVDTFSSQRLVVMVMWRQQSSDNLKNSSFLGQKLYIIILYEDKGK